MHRFRGAWLGRGIQQIWLEFFPLHLFNLNYASPKKCASMLANKSSRQEDGTYAQGEEEPPT